MSTLPPLSQLFELCSTEQSAAVASSRDQLRCQAFDDGIDQTLFARPQADGVHLVGELAGHRSQQLYQFIGVYAHFARELLPLTQADVGSLCSPPTFIASLAFFRSISS